MIGSLPLLTDPNGHQTVKDWNNQSVERKRWDSISKNRGSRIELGEIQALLEQLPNIQSAVPVVQENAPGDIGIVAYVVAAGEPPPTLDDLRSQLRNKVPHYMTPSAIVLLDSLPLTSSGDVDRQALLTAYSSLSWQMNYASTLGKNSPTTWFHPNSG